MTEIKKSRATIENLEVYNSMKKACDEVNSQDYVTLNDLLNKAQAYRDQFDWFCEIFEEQGAKGMKDVFGNVIIPAKYDDIWNAPSYHYINSIPVIAEKDGKVGLVRIMNGEPREITAFEYDYAHTIDWTLYTIVRKPGSDKLGLVDFFGKLVIPVEMDKIYASAANGNIFVEKDGKQGVYDICLEGFAYPVYDSIEGMGDGGALTFVKDGVEGCVDVDGKFYSQETLDLFYEGEDYDKDGNLIYDGEDGEPVFLADHLD